MANTITTTISVTLNGQEFSATNVHTLGDLDYVISEDILLDTTERFLDETNGDLIFIENLGDTNNIIIKVLTSDTEEIYYQIEPQESHLLHLGITDVVAAGGAPPPPSTSTVSSVTIKTDASTTACRYIILG